MANTLTATVTNILHKRVSEEYAMQWANENYGVLATYIRKEFMDTIMKERLENNTNITLNKMNNIAQTLKNGYLIFESSSTTTKQWTDFYNLFKKEFNKELKNLNATNIKYSKMHFCLSGFFTSKTGQIYYFSLGDVRGSNINLMYRTATSYTDYKGGGNQWVKIESGMFDNMQIK